MLVREDLVRQMVHTDDVRKLRMLYGPDVIPVELAYILNVSLGVLSVVAKTMSGTWPHVLLTYHPPERYILKKLFQESDPMSQSVDTSSTNYVHFQ